MRVTSSRFDSRMYSCPKGPHNLRPASRYPHIADLVQRSSQSFTFRMFHALILTRISFSFYATSRKDTYKPFKINIVLRGANTTNRRYMSSLIMLTSSLTYCTYFVSSFLCAQVVLWPESRVFSRRGEKELNTYQDTYSRISVTTAFRGWLGSVTCKMTKQPPGRFNINQHRRHTTPLTTSKCLMPMVRICCSLSYPFTKPMALTTLQ